MRQQKPLEEQQRILQLKYEMSAEDVARYHEEGFSFLDMDRAGLYAYITKKPVEDILKLRKTEYWMRIEKILHVTPEQYHEGDLRFRAGCAQRWWGMDAEKVYHLMEKGYPRHAIKLAWLVASHTGTPIEEILSRKKRGIRWADWAEANFHIAPDDFHAWLETVLNPIYHPEKSKK